MKFFGRNFLIACTSLLTIFFLHFVLFEWILDSKKSYFWPMYGFISAVFLISIILVELLERSFKEQLGYFFLIIIALKLVAVKIFIDSFPNKTEAEFKLSLLALYLISLVLLTWLTAKKLLDTES